MDGLGNRPDGVEALRIRCTVSMPIETSAVLLSAIGAILYIAGGIRFRRWVVEDRPGVPRYSANVETVILWLVYSVGVSIIIVVVRQTLRQF